MKQVLPGLLLAAVLAVAGNFLGGIVPHGVISGSVFALIIGMLLNPLSSKYRSLAPGLNFTSKKVLRLAIVLMGATLHFSQVVQVGAMSLCVMVFTLFTAFFGGWLVGKAFGMDWRLSSLISAGTGICGGSAIAAIAPTIEAEDRDVAYALSATFLFDIAMVILFPIMGRYFSMSDLGFGLWAGTAVNDTSSVVAAGYAFSDAAGNYALVVKLTRTLSIIPAVLVFAWIQQRSQQTPTSQTNRLKQISGIFPYFILLFLVVAAIKSTGAISESLAGQASAISKFCMVMALGAIGLKTNFREMAKSGIKPMLHGFIISTAVVVVSFAVQQFLGQL